MPEAQAPASQRPCRICQQPFLPFPLGEKNGYRLLGCKACGSVIADPWPTQKIIEDFYGEVQPEATHAERSDLVIDKLAKLVRKASAGVNAKTFLDISCRQGYAVKAAQDLGFKAAGISPYEFYIDFAKRNYGEENFETATAEDAAAAGRRADVVFCFEAFCEHPDPDAFASSLSSIVSPQGVIYIQEPDGNSFKLPRNFASWWFVDPPVNFLYISRKGMTKLLARHGLKIEKSLFTWGPFMRLVVTKK